MKRTVHRLDEVALPVELHAAEEGLFVVLEGPGGLEQLLAREVRRVNQVVATADVLALDDLLDEVADQRPLRMPEREPRPDQIVERVKIELLAERPVIPALGLFDPGEVFVELRLGAPGRAIDAL